MQLNPGKRLKTNERDSGNLVQRDSTVAIPIWIKQGINAWMTAAGIEDGRPLRSVSKSGKVNRDTLSDWGSGR